LKFNDATVYFTLLYFTLLFTLDNKPHSDRMKTYMETALMKGT